MPQRPTGRVFANALIIDGLAEKRDFITEPSRRLIIEVTGEVPPLQAVVIMGPVIAGKRIGVPLPCRDQVLRRDGCGRRGAFGRGGKNSLTPAPLAPALSQQGEGEKLATYKQSPLPRHAGPAWCVTILHRGRPEPALILRLQARCALRSGCTDYSPVRPEPFDWAQDRRRRSEVEGRVPSREQEMHDRLFKKCDSVLIA